MVNMSKTSHAQSSCTLAEEKQNVHIQKKWKGIKKRSCITLEPCQIAMMECLCENRKSKSFIIDASYCFITTLRLCKILKSV